jgi:hypothetical protein
VRAEQTRRIAVVLREAAWWRSMAMSGTTPEPRPTSSTGAVWSPSHTNQPPIGPRSSIWSPTSATLVR